MIDPKPIREVLQELADARPGAVGDAIREGIDQAQDDFILCDADDSDDRDDFYHD